MTTFQIRVQETPDQSAYFTEIEVLPPIIFGYGENPELYVQIEEIYEAWQLNILRNPRPGKEMRIILNFNPGEERYCDIKFLLFRNLTGIRVPVSIDWPVYSRPSLIPVSSTTNTRFVICPKSSFGFAVNNKLLSSDCLTTIITNPVSTVQQSSMDGQCGLEIVARESVNDSVGPATVIPVSPPFMDGGIDDILNFLKVAYPLSIDEAEDGDYLLIDKDIDDDSLLSAVGGA